MDLDTTDDVIAILHDAGLSSNPHDLDNPTQEFMVNKLLKFLEILHIDTSAILKPTIQQQQLMLSVDESTVSTLNLYGVIAKMSQRIFIKDFTIMDITNPSPKKTKRILKLLANFVLYVYGKEAEIKNHVDEIQSKKKELEHIITETNNTKEEINQIALQEAEQLSLQDKHQRDIENLRSLLETRHKVSGTLDEEILIVEQEKQQAFHQLRTVKTELTKINKAVIEMQSEIVTSPEEHKARLLELQEQMEFDAEERKTLEEALHDKKRLIEYSEKLFDFVKLQQKKLDELIEIVKRLKLSKSNLENIIKQKEIVAKTLSETAEKIHRYENQLANAEKKNTAVERKDERLSDKRKLYSQLLSDNQELQEEIKKQTMQQKEMILEIEKKRSMIKHVEIDTAHMINSYQERYDNEISEEKRLRDSWNKPEH